MEAAKGLMNRGMKVDVIHLMGWLMETQLDSKSGQFLKQSLEELGVTFHLEKLTTAVMCDCKVTGLEFKDGETLDRDMVVVSAGVRPNVDLARMAGLHVRRGILVNDSGSGRRGGHVRRAQPECVQKSYRAGGQGQGSHPAGRRADSAARTAGV